MFSPVSIRAMGCRVSYVTGSHTFNNPTSELIKEATDHFGRTRPVACVISLGCGQRAVRTADGISQGNGTDLIEAIASDPEIVHQDLSWRIGGLNLYGRFRIGPVSHSEAEPSQDTVESVVTHSKVHLGQADTMESIDRCVAAAERLGRSTLGDICMSPILSVILVANSL